MVNILYIVQPNVWVFHLDEAEVQRSCSISSFAMIIKCLKVLLWCCWISRVWVRVSNRSVAGSSSSDICQSFLITEFDFRVKGSFKPVTDEISARCQRKLLFEDLREICDFNTHEDQSVSSGWFYTVDTRRPK